MTGARNNDTGFTLVELVVALFIFAMLASAGIGLLRFSAQAQSATKARLDDIAGERRLSVLLANDLAQVLPRTSRDVNGGSLPAFRARAGNELMAYVRGGRSNGTGVARSALQTTTWRLANGRLERITHPMVDGAAPVEPVVLARDIVRAEIRFRQAGQWRSDWSPVALNALPNALELTLTRKGRAPLTRMFIVGAGY